MNISQKLFTIFKTTSVPDIDVDILKTIITNYIYLNNKLNLDKLEIYESIEINCETVHHDITITFVAVRSRYKLIQLDIIIVSQRRDGDNSDDASLDDANQDENQVMVLLSSNYNQVLVQFIDQYNTSILKLTSPSILTTVNLILSQPNANADKIGNVDVVYSMDSHHLSTMAINIPQNDLHHLHASQPTLTSTITDMDASLIHQDNSLFINNLHRFMYHTTKINVKHCKLIKFLSNGVYLYPGKVKVVGYDSETVIRCLYTVMTEQHRADNLPTADHQHPGDNDQLFGDEL